MNAALMRELGDGHNVVFYGTSQSATIQTLEMNYLDSLPADERPAPDQLAFVDYGDPDLPNGGLLARFDYPDLPTNLGAPAGLTGNWTVPTMGVTFVGPTPPDTPYPNVVYTGEYDVFADFPRYPIDILADLNAIAGGPAVHDDGSDKPASLIATAIPWQTSPGYDGNTTYFIISTPDLPLSDPLRGNPIGNAFADLLQPDLKVIINLGCGPDNVGFGQYPNVFTPASGLLPDVNPATLLNELVSGAHTGVQDFLADLTAITPSSLTASLTSQLATITPDHLDPANPITQLQTLVTVNVNALSQLSVGPFDAAMPTADLLTALLQSLPAVNINLVLAGLGQLADGDMSQAFVDFTNPIGSTAGLATFGLAFLLESVLDVPSTIKDALTAAATTDLDFLAGLPSLL